jgi:hypothetical protein
MNGFNMPRIIESKLDRRRRLAALPFAEKLRLLEAMRQDLLAIRAARPSGPTGRHPSAQPNGLGTRTNKPVRPERPR